MTTNRDVYEGKILETLIKNNERLAVNEKEVSDIKQTVLNIDRRLNKIEELVGLVKLIAGGVVAIALSLIANVIYSIIT